MAEPRIVVVGAGIGGLVSALLLAHRGLDVTLVDAADRPGGKMRQLRVDGAAIDAGPTVFTMRWVFDELLAEVGSSLESLVALSPLQVLARHAWRGHEARLDLFADRARSADAIGRFALANARLAGRKLQDLRAGHDRTQVRAIEARERIDGGNAVGEILGCGGDDLRAEGHHVNVVPSPAACQAAGAAEVGISAQQKRRRRIVRGAAAN